MKLKENFIPLRDKIEAGADLVRTITSYMLNENIVLHKIPEYRVPISAICVVLK